MISEWPAPVFLGLIQEAPEHSDHSFHELFLLFIVHLSVPSHYFQLIEALLAELLLYLLNLVGLEAGQVVVEGGYQVNDLCRQVSVFLVALLQDLPHDLHSLQLGGDRGHVELHFHCVVEVWGLGEDLEELRILVDLQKHVLDTVETRFGDSWERPWNFWSGTNFGLKKVFHCKIRNAGLTLQKEILKPLKEVLLVVWDWWVRHKDVPNRVKLVLLYEIDTCCEQ